MTDSAPNIGNAAREAELKRKLEEAIRAKLEADAKELDQIAEGA